MLLIPQYKETDQLTRSKNRIHPFAAFEKHISPLKRILYGKRRETVFQANGVRKQSGHHHNIWQKHFKQKLFRRNKDAHSILTKEQPPIRQYSYKYILIHHRCTQLDKANTSKYKVRLIQHSSNFNVWISPIDR